MVKLLRIVQLSVLLPLSFAFGPKGIKHAETPLQEVKTCFEGYVLYSDGTCVQEINEDPNPICPQGQVGGQGCRVEVPYVMKCPDGYASDTTGQCSHLVTIDATYFCPVGFEDNGEDCIQMIPSETIVTCEDGELIGQQCVNVERVAYTVSAYCPDDTVVEDGSCWRILENFDCTGHFVCEPACDESGCGESAKGKSKLRRLKAKEKKRKQQEVPISTTQSLVAVSAPRASRVTLVQQICQRRIEVAPNIEKSCPMNFIDDGDSCLKEELTPPQVLCATTGSSITGNCPPTVHRSVKIPRCPDNNAPVNYHQCDSIVIAPPIVYCPSGFQDNGFACEGFLPPPLECSGDLQLINGRCVGRRVREALTFRLADEFGQKSK